MAIPEVDAPRCARMLQEGRFDAATELAEELVASRPEAGMFWHMLGAARLGAGKVDDAVAALRRAVSLSPEDAAALNHLGVACQRAGRRDEAADAFARSLERNDGVAAVWSNAASNALDRGRRKQALQWAERALALNPSLAQAHLARGNALAALKQRGEAVEALDRAARLDSRSIPIRMSLGALLARMSGRSEEGLSMLEQVLAERPDHAACRATFANELYTAGRIVEACEHYRQAIRLDPQNASVWTGYLYALAHVPGADPARTFEEHRAFGRMMADRRGDEPATHANDRDPERRLRVGFVSADLRAHAVAYFAEPFWRRLRDAGFELYAYHNSADEDAVTGRLRALTDQWLRVDELDDRALDARIREDRVDILFDLSGHTAGNRLGVFARKPAPVQITWIGYPGTTGLDTMDYRIVNSLMVRAGELDAFFTEKLIRLPVPADFSGDELAPAVGPLPALERGHITFGSLNRASKLSDASVALWVRVLQAMPQAHMMVGDMTGDGVRARLEAIFERGGIVPERLRFVPRKRVQEYLQLFGEVDVLLDTFPYASGTTARHGLSMGVPTLTLVTPGSGIQQRAAASALRWAGLDEWIASSEDDFVARAVSLTADVPALARLRSGMRDVLLQRRGGTRDTEGLSRALREVWRRWCAGGGPETVEVGTAHERDDGEGRKA